MLLLAATAVYSCEALTILEEPLGRSAKSSLADEKSSPPRHGVRQTTRRLCPSMVLHVLYIRRCRGSSYDVVMLRGWSVHHKDQRRRKWWRSCRGFSGTNIWPLIGSKFAKRQLNARQSRKNRVYLAFSSQKQVRCEAGQSQDSLRVICTWFKMYLFLARK